MKGAPGWSRVHPRCCGVCWIIPTTRNCHQGVSPLLGGLLLDGRGHADVAGGLSPPWRDLLVGKLTFLGGGGFTPVGAGPAGWLPATTGFLNGGSPPVPRGLPSEVGALAYKERGSPHSRGACSLIYPARTMVPGLPPVPRGLPSADVDDFLIDGFTPAPAGRAVFFFSSPGQGPPPRRRGLREPCHCDQPPRRRGLLHGRAPRRSAPGVHPRVGGVCGHLVRVSSAPSRFTPASAGSAALRGNSYKTLTGLPPVQRGLHRSAP